MIAKSTAIEKSYLCWTSSTRIYQNKYAFVRSILTDVVILSGLAPEIPEDLYMLIKKVRISFIFDLSM